jgi:histidinol-phosphate aminotransferase
MSEFPMIPHARPEVSEPGLKRPDWIKNVSRKPELLWLDKNENTDPEHLKAIADVLSRIDPLAYTTYPEAPELYEKLARHLGAKPDQLIVGAGSDGIIRSVFESFVSPGDVVITTMPTFAMYDVYSRIYGAQKVGLEYRPSNAGPVLTAEEIVEAIQREKPRLVGLPNPDSPTGTVFNLEDMRAIIKAAGNAGAVMLVDEAYYPFHADSVAPLIAEFPHLVVARSTSKAWGLAGLRIGYAITSPEMATILHKVKPMYECSTFGMVGLSHFLDRPELMEKTVARLEEGKNCFLDAMEKLGFRVLRGKGNFCHVSFGAQADAVHRALADVCYYRKDFNEPCLKGFSRFSSTTKERFAPVIDAITGVVKGR